MTDVHEATIKNLTIEVKVMKIGNRQVTLSVFRQLKQENIIDPQTTELCGIPWGTVNYHVDCDEIKGDHLHVVWQKGTELRRAIACIPWQLGKESTKPPSFHPEMWKQLLRL